MNQQEEARPGPNQRTLKIETVGDFACGEVKPRIRLSGYWLAQAGFKPGHRVEIRLLNPGEMNLQFKEDPPLSPRSPPRNPTAKPDHLPF